MDNYPFAAEGALKIVEFNQYWLSRGSEMSEISGAHSESSRDKNIYPGNLKIYTNKVDMMLEPKQPKFCDPAMFRPSLPSIFVTFVIFVK